jgi:hypothetical protein
VNIKLCSFHSVLLELHALIFREPHQSTKAWMASERKKRSQRESYRNVTYPESNALKFAKRMKQVALANYSVDSGVWWWAHLPLLIIHQTKSFLLLFVLCPKEKLWQAWRISAARRQGREPWPRRGGLGIWSALETVTDPETEAGILVACKFLSSLLIVAFSKHLVG